MIYLDSGATSFRKPSCVWHAVQRACHTCASPGRGGYLQAMQASKVVGGCRIRAGEMFECKPEQVLFTSNCTHGLNIAINTLVKEGSKVLVSGFEHNAVMRPLHMRKAKIRIAGKQLFAWDDMLDDFERELRRGVDVAVFTHTSNVFGYILPIEQMAELCREFEVPFVIDAAQSAGILPISMGKLGAEFIAMPGHKGLLGPQGTGILLCKAFPIPLIQGGTGSVSELYEMPDFLPDGGEAGTLNVPGIAGLSAGIRFLQKQQTGEIASREALCTEICAKRLQELNFRVFTGKNQSGVLSFIPDIDCEEYAQLLAENGVAVRAGLHCAPLAHKTAGTFDTGTVRVSFGYDCNEKQVENFINTVKFLSHKSKKIMNSYC